MAEFEDKLNSILSNPALMGQIMSMAGSLGTPPSPPPQPQQSVPQADSFSGLDPAALQGMMHLLKSTQVDAREQRLLQALDGYLPHDRLQKLTKAMQAAKIAKFASGALSQGR